MLNWMEDKTSLSLSLFFSPSTSLSLSLSLYLFLTLSLLLSLPLSHSLSLTGEEGVRSLLTGQREREREKGAERAQMSIVQAESAGVLLAFHIQSVSQHA